MKNSGDDSDFRRAGGFATSEMDRNPASRRPRTVRGLALLMLLGCLLVPAGVARARVVPEGAALWFACTTPAFTGPDQLRCPQPYAPGYLQTFLAGFNRFTPENEFQMQYLEPDRDHFDFGLADTIDTFARTHHMTIRGHALVWWQEQPYWFTHPLLPWSYNDLSSILDTYISTVVGHFAHRDPGTVREWDVVNEPLEQDGSFIPTEYEQVLGPHYVAMALQDAHLADPSAALAINDSETGVPTVEANAMLNLAADLVSQGVPLNTIGIEAHVTTATAASLAQLLTMFRQYAQIGLNVEFTEVDVNNAAGVDDPAAKQEIFERYAKACQLAPNCTGYTVWGVANRYSWLGPDTDALLYGAGFEASPAVAVVQHDLTSPIAETTRPGVRPKGAGRARPVVRVKGIGRVRPVVRVKGIERAKPVMRIRSKLKRRLRA